MRPNRRLTLDTSLNLHYFYEISKIPRPSFHEERIADYVEQFAKDRNLWYTRDFLHNIIIKKPGSPGREAEPPLILQAHMDMVCAKSPESRHDFLKDPIHVLETEGWLHGDGTTLGADDGAGVANILTLLDEKDLSHPPLECILTVQEEDGMGGAKGIDLSPIQGKRMIGLDGNYEGTTIYTAAAVNACQCRLQAATTPTDGICCELTVSGLTSGHGAMMIGAQRANAIKVVARLLDKLMEQVPHMRLCSLYGGGLIHVIPRECTAGVISALPASKLQELLQPEIQQIIQEHAATDPEMKISLSAIDHSQRMAVTSADTKRFLTFLHLLPVGATNRNPENLEQVTASINLSIVKLMENQLRCDIVCRGNHPVDVMDNRRRVAELGELFGAECETTMEYAGHFVPTDSPLIQLWSRVYQRSSGKPLGLIYIHAGLDAGTIFQRLGLKDLVVIMPNTLDVHTINERMELASFQRTYNYLKEILAEA